MPDPSTTWDVQTGERPVASPYHDAPEDVENSGEHHHLIAGSSRERRKLNDNHDDSYNGTLPAFMTRLPVAAATRRRTMWIAGVGVVVFVLLVAFFQSSSPPKGFSKKDFSACYPDKDLECGFISVPRNYLNVSAGRTEIAVARYLATDRKRRIGTIFLNPGGPGGSGVNFAFHIAKPLSRLLLGRYDIIGFDPRGVGRTRPSVACFASAAEDLIFRANTPLVRGFDVPAKLDAPDSRASILSQMRDWMSWRKALFEVCQNAPGSEDLVHMSTTTVARDIDYMATALDGEDSMINYLGLSYGTILGSYLVNMFPDRVGRVAIDGVVDPQKWAQEPAHTWLDTWMNSTELAYDYLLTLCDSAGPEQCSLARMKGDSAQDIGARVESFLEKLYNEPAAVTNAPRPGVITSGMVRTLIYSAMTAPKWFPRIAEAIAAAMKGNYTELAILTMQTAKQPSHRQPGDHARSIIACLDSPPYEADKPDTWPTAEGLADAAIARLKDVSPRFGLAPLLTEPDGACQFMAKTTKRLPERFTGPFHSKLRNPILIVNGDTDPLTPLISARFVNNQLGESARLVIQRNSPAHTSFWFGPSLCVARAYRRFFVSGLVPESKETLCAGSDLSIFDTEASPVRAQAASQAASHDHAPDAELRSVVKDLSQVLYNWIPIGLSV